MPARPEWACLDIGWPSRSMRITPPRHGDDAHRLAALAAEAGKAHPRTLVDPAMFHHHLTESGVCQNTNGLSPIRYGVSKTGMSITAVGEQAVECLEDNGHKLTRALSAMAGTPLRESWRRGHLGLRVTRGLNAYVLPRVLVTRQQTARVSVGADLSSGAFTPALATWLAQKIRDGIERQAALVGMALPEDESPIVAVTGIEKTTGWNRDGIHFGTLVHGIQMSSNLALEGPWAVGHLCLTGNGRVLRLRERSGDELDSPA